MALIDGLITLITDSSVPGKAYENVLGRGYELPATVIHQTGGTQDMDMAGAIAVREDDIQLDYYGRTAVEARHGGAALRALLCPTGAADWRTLPGGTVIFRACVEIDMAMPYRDGGDAKGLLDRWLLKIHFVSNA